MKADVARGRRGRPPKFGRPGQVVAVTLPEEVIQGLRKLHPDLAWAIVRLFNTAATRRPIRAHAPDDVELVTVGGRRSLIVVNRELFSRLAAINIIPLDHDRAFLALDPGCGMSDLELAVIDRLAIPSLDRRERVALEGLRTRLRQWRSDPGVRCEPRAIILLERVGGADRPTKRPRKTR